MGALSLKTAGGVVRAGLSTLARSAARAAPAYAARAIAGAFAPIQDGPRLSALQLQTSTEGAPIPLVYGRMRLAGQVIWAARFKERSQVRSAGGGKGGPKVREYDYSISFAVALCEGLISAIGKVWANGEPLSTAGLSMRVHHGGEDQAADPLIEAIEGAGQAPAYRGLAYVVFEDLPLSDFGGRIPSLSFEVIGGGPKGEGPRMETLVEGVCLIPASGEFAYADTEVLREIGEGYELSENRHTARASCDLVAAIDDLEARLPNCRSVALVTAWFGDDLRMGECTLRPGVETRDKITRPLEWRSAGLHRGNAHLVSQGADGPVYGGTPSDETVIAAIKLLKARGYAVTLYPFILMDVPAGNGLPDPYGAAEQAVFPWRGRITCHPAPGETGSPDKTAAATGQVADFFGAVSAEAFSVNGEQVNYSGPNEWRFRRFILHHAALAKAAGGVDTFIIGSEMRGLTQVRSGVHTYPAVTEMTRLTEEVRELLPNADLSYAADWSEYFGHAPNDGTGDRLFHLDALWSHPDIDFVGIDWYAPLSDWRDGEAHLDRLAGAPSIYDRAYLDANVEGGEGFDWYYASPADREAQIRTPITDGAYSEPWIWRFKDLKGWWANAHHDRIAGVRQASPTGWLPESKPVRLVELGCPAVDKGANQPNVFIDPKSSESFAPYHSSGARDDFIQRRYIEALLAHWAPEAGNNPVSAVYGGAMLDLSRSHVWTWDARPFPEFPAREDVWSDGANWRRGHWITGRAGQSELGDLVADIAARSGLQALEVSGVEGVVSGFVLDRPVRARDVLTGLGEVFGFDLADRAGGAVCAPRRPVRTPVALAGADLADEGEGQIRLSRAPAEARAVEARLSVVSDDGDYRPAQVSARGLDTLENGVVTADLPVLADRTLASVWAEGLLANTRLAAEGARLALPPSKVWLEPGDPVTLDAGPAGRVWRITALDGLLVRGAALSPALAGPALPAGPDPGAGDAASPASRPLLRLLDLPVGPRETGARGGLWAAGWAKPWPGALALSAGADLESASERVRLEAPAFTGVLESALNPGAEGRWDRAARLKVRLADGALSSVPPLAALAGETLAAVKGGEGWEVIAFTGAALQPDGAWLLTGLLRGLSGSPANAKAIGANFVLLDGAGAVLPVTSEERGADLFVALHRVEDEPGGGAARQVTARYEGADLKPLRPVHVRTRRRGGDLELSWTRRDRIDADAWARAEIPMSEAREAYRVELFDGGVPAGAYETVEPRLMLDAGALAAAFPAGLGAASARIAQISDAFGPGSAATAPLDPSTYD
ncbi:MAG: glycoside hydrolase/phage tail family protein [Oceanicaulis sp.]